jgi:imidazolonepropionase
MIDSGVPTAIATDFCPNAHCLSLPFAMSLACLNLKVTPSEALCGVTLNAAAAINRHKTIGSIEVGKQGDFVILDAPSWMHLVY